MKKGISFLSSLLLFFVSLSALAAEPYIPFTTIEMAEEYCPSIYNLIFTPSDPSVAHSTGAIEGSLQPGSVFKNSSPDPAPAPESPESGSGNIQGATFRESDNMYGYIAETEVSCYYWYPMYNGTQTALVMQGNRTP